MIYHLPGDPTLPPGCTHAMIDQGIDPGFEHECKECECPIQKPGLCRRCEHALRAEEEADREKDEQR